MRILSRIMNSVGGERSTAQLVAAWVGIAVATAGAVACLVAFSQAMRSVMIDAGGFCANGGPYVVQNECDGATAALLTAAVPLMLVFMGVRAALTAWVGGPGLGVFPPMGLLFAVLGWNFIELGFDPPGPTERAWGWIVSGITFWVMAVGFLMPLIWRVPRWFHEDGSGSGSLVGDGLGAAALTMRGAADPQGVELGRVGTPVAPVRRTMSRGTTMNLLVASVVGAIAGVMLGLRIADAVLN